MRRDAVKQFQDAQFDASKAYVATIARMGLGKRAWRAPLKLVLSDQISDSRFMKLRINID